MPLLEINQIRHIHASADDVVDKDAPEQPAKKLATGVEPTASVRAVKGVTRQSISRQSKTVLRTGRMLTLQPWQVTAKIIWYLDRCHRKHNVFAKHGIPDTGVESYWRFSMAEAHTI